MSKVKVQNMNYRSVLGIKPGDIQVIEKTEQVLGFFKSGILKELKEEKKIVKEKKEKKNEKLGEIYGGEL